MLKSAHIYQCIMVLDSGKAQCTAYFEFINVAHELIQKYSVN